MTIHINSREEDILHLVVSEFIRWLVGSYQHLASFKGYFRVLCAVQVG